MNEGKARYAQIIESRILPGKRDELISVAMARKKAVLAVAEQLNKLLGDNPIVREFVKVLRECVEEEPWTAYIGPVWNDLIKAFKEAPMDVAIVAGVVLLQHAGKDVQARELACFKREEKSDEDRTV